MIFGNTVLREMALGLEHDYCTVDYRPQNEFILLVSMRESGKPQHYRSKADSGSGLSQNSGRTRASISEAS
jgi:hypothetical protein